MRVDEFVIEREIYISARKPEFHGRKTLRLRRHAEAEMRFVNDSEIIPLISQHCRGEINFDDPHVRL